MTKTFRALSPYSWVSKAIGRLGALAEAWGIGCTLEGIRAVKMVFCERTLRYCRRRKT